MPIGNRTMGTVVVGKDIYVMGGGPSNCGFTARVFKYDTAADSWAEVVQMPQARDNVGGASVKGKVYAVGGATSCGSPTPNTSRVDVYDPIGDSWSTLATPLPTGRINPAVVELNGLLYVFGGNFDAMDARKYDPNTDSWTALAASAPGNVNCGGQPCAVAVNGKIYVVRGVNEEVLEYDPVGDTWATKAPIPSSRGGFGVVAVGKKIYVVGGQITSPKSYPTDVLVYDTSSDSWSSLTSSGFTGRSALAVALVNNTIYAIGGAEQQAAPSIIYDLVQFVDLNPPKPVGGIALEPELRGLPVEAGSQGGGNVGVLAGVIAGVTAGAITVALGGAAWYARRRRLR